MYRVPRSLLLLPATGFLFLLQLFPLTGVFLMMLAAPFWSVLLINGAFIGTATEVALKAVPRWWLLLPIAWFGGYAIVAGRDHFAVAALRAELAASNGKARFRFNPERNSLVFVGENSDAAWLVKNYDLPVAYELTTPDISRMRSHRIIARSLCSQIRANAAFQGSHIWTSGFFDDGPIGKRRMDRRFCKLTQFEQPSLAQARLEIHEFESKRGTLPVVFTNIDVRSPDGEQAQLRGGSASPLYWLPMPVIGCALNSGAAKWQCFAGFDRQRRVPLVERGSGYNSTAVMIANAFGLRRVRPEDRKAAPTEQVLPVIRKAEENAVAADLKELDSMVRDPVGNNHWGHFRALKGRPDVLAEWDDRIVAGLERAYVDPANTRESGRSLADLVATLPDSSWRRLGPRVLALYERSNWHWIRDQASLVARFGDLQPAPLPLLINLYRDKRPGGLAAICRVGQPAGKFVTRELLNTLRDPSMNRSEAGSIFVALVRMGARDEALKVNAERRRPVHPRILERIGANPGPDLCSGIY